MHQKTSFSENRENGNAPVCAAQSQGADQHFTRGEDWSISIGALGSYKPAYEGSDDYEFRAFPLVNVTLRDTFFFNAQNGLGAYIWNRDALKLGLSLGYIFGRDEDDSSGLRGLGDIDGGAVANILLKWSVGDVALNARCEKQITGQGTGFQVHLGLGYNLQITEKTILEPSIKTTYASSDYMDEYFSISPSQSNRSGMSVYDAASGFKSFGFQITITHSLDQHWGILASAGYDRLVGEAADSPVVKDAGQYLLTMGLSYKF